MDGSPREAEAKPQAEVTFKFQKNWHFRLDTGLRYLKQQRRHIGDPKIFPSAPLT
jgi:hypothetical protein